MSEELKRNNMSCKSAKPGNEGKATGQEKKKSAPLDSQHGVFKKPTRVNSYVPSGIRKRDMQLKRALMENYKKRFQAAAAAHFCQTGTANVFKVKTENPLGKTVSVNLPPKAERRPCSKFPQPSGNSAISCVRSTNQIALNASTSSGFLGRNPYDEIVPGRSSSTRVPARNPSAYIAPGRSAPNRLPGPTTGNYIVPVSMQSGGFIRPTPNALVSPATRRQLLLHFPFARPTSCRFVSPMPKRLPKSNACRSNRPGFKGLPGCPASKHVVLLCSSRSTGYLGPKKADPTKSNALPGCSSSDKVLPKPSMSTGYLGPNPSDPLNSNAQKESPSSDKIVLDPSKSTKCSGPNAVDPSKSNALPKSDASVKKLRGASASNGMKDFPTKPFDMKGLEKAILSVERPIRLPDFLPLKMAIKRKFMSKY